MNPVAAMLLAVAVAVGVLVWAEHEFERKPCQEKGGTFSRGVCFAPGVVLK